MWTQSFKLGLNWLWGLATFLHHKLHPNYSCTCVVCLLRLALWWTADPSKGEAASADIDLMVETAVNQYKKSKQAYPFKGSSRAQFH